MSLSQIDVWCCGSDSKTIFIRIDAVPHAASSCGDISRSSSKVAPVTLSATPDTSDMYLLLTQSILSPGAVEQAKSTTEFVLLSRHAVQNAPVYVPVSRDDVCDLGICKQQSKVNLFHLGIEIFSVLWSPCFVDLIVRKTCRNIHVTCKLSLKKHATEQILEEYATTRWQ